MALQSAYIDRNQWKWPYTCGGIKIIWYIYNDSDINTTRKVPDKSQMLRLGWVDKLRAVVTGVIIVQFGLIKKIG